MLTYTKSFTVSSSFAIGNTETQEEHKAIALAESIVKEKAALYLDLEVRQCRTVKDANLEKIGLSFSAPNSILWQRHWVLHMGDKFLGEITLTESWA